MSRNRLSDRGLKMLANFESTVLTVYRDVAGIETVCTGHVVRPEDRAWLADGVTADECRAVLARDVAVFEEAVNRVVRVPVAQPMIDAMVSLAFNIGAGAFASSTVVARLNMGDYAGAADAFLLWRYARVRQKDGTYERRPVLTSRREHEAALFRSGIPWVLQPEPTLEELAARAYAVRFTTHQLLDAGPEAPEPTDTDAPELGRLVCLPPDDDEPIIA